MIDEFEARQRILSSVSSASTAETVGLPDSLDRIAASNVIGRIDLPGFDNSAMDGYAVRASEASSGAVLKVGGEQEAGIDRKLRLGIGEAIRIFTGAPIPEGADAVVMQEDTCRSADGASIEIVEGVEPGEFIRRRGSDVCAGQRMIERGMALSPAKIGLLASQGYRTVEVFPRPRIGIVTTGDEVVEGGAFSSNEMPDGQLFNSNGPMLEALARRAGGIPHRWHARDEPDELTRILSEAMASSDFVVIAGGVSVGDRDFVKECLQSLGVVSEFWRVRVKPGKPFLFGHRGGESPVHVFGLPGNPVSAFVTWHLFAGPALARWQGGRGEVESLHLPRVQGVLDRRLENPGDRPHYLRMRLDSATGILSPTGLQQSHALYGLSRADALLRLEAGQTAEAGESMTAWIL